MSLIKILFIHFLHKLTFTANILEVFASSSLFSYTSSNKMSLRTGGGGVYATFRAGGGKIPHEPLELIKKVLDG